MASKTKTLSCGDNGGVKADGSPCGTTKLVGDSGRCRHHQETEATPKRKRGRPKGSKNRQKTVSESSKAVQSTKTLQGRIEQLQKAEETLKQHPTSKMAWAILRIHRESARRSDVESLIPDNGDFKGVIDAFRVSCSRDAASKALDLASKGVRKLATQLIRDHALPFVRERAVEAGYGQEEVDADAPAVQRKGKREKPSNGTDARIDRLEGVMAQILDKLS